MKNKNVLPIGAVVIAKKNMFMKKSISISPHGPDQFLTKNKEYKIVAEPRTYDNPIEIIDDDGITHCCPTSYFK